MKYKLVKKIVIINIIFLISIILGCNNIYAVNNTSINDISSNIQNDENAKEIINDLLDTFEKNGTNKESVSVAISKYQELTSEYSNDDLAKILEDNKEQLEKSNISSEDIDNVSKVLKNFDSEQLNKALDKVDIDTALNELQSGSSISDVVKKATDNMTTADKVDLAFSFLWSANVVQYIVIGISILIVYKVLIRCVIYKKAKKHAWASFIPIYRDIVMLKICGMSPLWLLLIFVPVIGWLILWIIKVVSRFLLAEAFDKNPGFGFGLWLLNPIFESIIAFSRKTKYIGIEK